MKPISQWKPISMHPIVFWVLMIAISTASHLFTHYLYHEYPPPYIQSCHDQQKDCLHACDSLMNVIEGLESAR